jgi:aminobenzoyl-glutamate transport protein
VNAIEKAADVPRLMGEGIKQMAPVLVLFFAIAQFLAYFSWSRIGDLLSAESARVLGDLGAPTVVIFLGILALLTLINVLVTSGSAS